MKYNRNGEGQENIIKNTMGRYDVGNPSSKNKAEMFFNFFVLSLFTTR